MISEVNHAAKEGQLSMDEKSEKTLTAVKYVLLAAASVLTAARNSESLWAILALSGLLLLSMTIRGALIYPAGKYRAAGMLAVAFDILFAYIMGSLDAGFGSELVYFVIILDVSLFYSTPISALTAAVCFTAFAADYAADRAILPENLQQFSYHLLAFSAVFAVAHVVKYEIRQSNKLRNTMYELKVRTKQLENTYLKLKSASQDLEEIAIVQERTRITREIHDTVGHTLTTALVELEAGDRLIGISPLLASEKIALAKGQIRKGLGDIRDSVKLLQAGLDTKNFVQSVKRLIEETTAHGDIYIKHEIQEVAELEQAQAKALYRALQEGLTNGIRHGGGTAFVVKIKKEDESIKFLLQDNGKGCNKIIKGFGLMSMEERIKELGGILVAASEPEEGFMIDITIPLQRRGFQ